MNPPRNDTPFDMENPTPPTPDDFQFVRCVMPASLLEEGAVDRAAFLIRQYVEQQKKTSAPERDLVFGEAVECRTYAMGEWLGDFIFLAYVPRLSRPYLVRAAIEGNYSTYPPRLHAECRRASKKLPDL